MLLSVVIPTKNRQFTALYAIESALVIPYTDMEVIVQDCSDEPELEQQIKEKFGNDKRIIYSYSDDQPSMTENWNRALSVTRGDYVIGIGDDDAVLKEIYSIAAWAKHRDIEAVVHTFPYFYFWPGYFPQTYNGTFGLRHDFFGSVKETDYHERVKEYGSLHEPLSFMMLPSIYHGLISRRLLGQLREETGTFLDSTSLDIYTAIAFSKFIDQYTVIDYPFSIKGASPKSNTQRMYTKRVKDHFAEYKKIDLPEILPQGAGVAITAAESFIRACKNTHREELISLIDLPVLYANIAFEDSSLYESCKEKLNKFVDSPAERNRFDNWYQDKLRTNNKTKRIVARIVNFIKKKTGFIYMLYKKLTPGKDATRVKIFPESDIMSGINKVHYQYIEKNKIKLSDIINSPYEKT